MRTRAIGTGLATVPRDQTIMVRSDPDNSRLNLLLSYGGWREESAVDQLPRLLKPLGITSLRAASGEEAASVIRTVPIHIAVVDFAIPLRSTATSAEAGGARILQLLRRLDQPPPTVVIRPPQPARASARGLADALREGAFAVLDQPINLETMLEVMRRILRRYYADVWPGCRERKVPRIGNH